MKIRAKGVLNLPYKYTMYNKQGEIIHSCPFIFNVELDDIVPYNEQGFAPIHDKVSRIKFTLEEFKMLDGFVAWFKFTKHFILFKGLVLGYNYINERVGDERVPHYFSEGDMYARGEKLFLMD